MTPLSISSREKGIDRASSRWIGRIKPARSKEISGTAETLILLLKAWKNAAAFSEWESKLLPSGPFSTAILFLLYL